MKIEIQISIENYNKIQDYIKEQFDEEFQLSVEEYISQRLLPIAIYENDI